MKFSSTHPPGIRSFIPLAIIDLSPLWGIGLLLAAFFAHCWYYMEVPPISERVLRKIPANVTQAELESYLGRKLSGEAGSQELQYQSYGHWKVIKFHLSPDGRLQSWMIDD